MATKESARRPDQASLAAQMVRTGAAERDWRACYSWLPMAGSKETVSRLLPARLSNWLRRKRINTLEAAGGATRITPGVVATAFSRKTAAARSAARRTVLRAVPDRVVNKMRRRRATRAYLDALSWELLERETRLDFLEGRVAARRDGFYERMVHDVVERTEIILQELDRRIEGLTARTGERFQSLDEQLDALRGELARLRTEAAGDPASPDGEAAHADAEAVEHPTSAAR